jgi:hypothetical protein
MSSFTQWWNVSLIDGERKKMYGSTTSPAGFVECARPGDDVDWEFRIWPWHRIELVTR